MPCKLKFDHRKRQNKMRREMENRQESQTKESRDINAVKPVRWNSMEHLKPDFSCDPR
ncbi:hypothetical protein IRJ41_006923 [Triplophysa rosa]|uniref:Uncharacterized protein n=1 Tax=Triplophysa rosa TaxID=992332 RepID=A0A9W7TEF0_TRIRA|nr:hypothetical protein IRJ41_006923 [Triplophysa rosa]